MNPPQADTTARPPAFTEGGPFGWRDALQLLHPPAADSSIHTPQMHIFPLIYKRKMVKMDVQFPQAGRPPSWRVVSEPRSCGLRGCIGYLLWPEMKNQPEFGLEKLRDPSDPNLFRRSRYAADITGGDPPQQSMRRSHEDRAVLLRNTLAASSTDAKQHPCSTAFTFASDLPHAPLTLEHQI